MSCKPYLLVLDHGTTGVRACLLNTAGEIVSQGYEKIPLTYPQPGWVEQDPVGLWQLTEQVVAQAFANISSGWHQVEAIGLTNQRETTILWNVETGEPVYPAIVWQCRRTHEACEALKQAGEEAWVREKTGLVLDPYFSATKIAWILEHVPLANALLAENKLRFGTVDSWILWHLSGRKTHRTDLTNASRTLLFNIEARCWDTDLLNLFGVPASILPEVLPSGGCFGQTEPQWSGGFTIPITGILGDQQAALYGQKCWQAGQSKSTYGTGAFLMTNVGSANIRSQQGLLTTLACDATGNPCYALEGAIFMAGATLEWLQHPLELLESVSAIEALVDSIPNNEGVYLVPAFAGLGAPYWDAQARGALLGLTRGSGKAHVVRAALEAIAYQTREVLQAMESDAGLLLQSLRIDGGVTRSRFLSQFLADLLNIPIVRTENAETTALGAGYLAGLTAGFWESPEQILALPEQQHVFKPHLPEEARYQLWTGWQNAVSRVLR